MSKEQNSKFIRYIKSQPKPIEPLEIKEDKPLKRRPEPPAPTSPYDLLKQPKLTFVYYGDKQGYFS